MIEYEFKVGQKVRFKSLEKLIATYGDGSGWTNWINTKTSFAPSMRPLCGTTAVIKSIDRDKVVFEDDSFDCKTTGLAWKYWCYSLDMIEPIDNKKTTVKGEKPAKPVEPKSMKVAKVAKTTKTALINCITKLQEVIDHIKETYDINMEDINMEDINMEDINMEDINMEDINMEDINMEDINE